MYTQTKPGDISCWKVLSEWRKTKLLHPVLYLELCLVGGGWRGEEWGVLNEAFIRSRYRVTILSCVLKNVRSRY